MYVKVYTKDNCPACRITKKYLVDHGVTPVVINLADADGNPVDDDARDHIELFKLVGYKQFPVVTVAPGGCLVNEFCGFKPNELADTVTMWDETCSDQTSIEQIREYDNLHGYRGAPGINPNIDVDTLNNL